MTQTHFIAVAADPAAQLTIDGIGHTAEEAIAAAAEASGADADSFVAQPCTFALYEAVRHIGTPRGWTQNHAGLQDLEAAPNPIVEAILTAIETYKANGGENEGGFSINITRFSDDNSYDADVIFADDYTKTVYLAEGTAEEQVQKIWNCDVAELKKIVDLFEGEGWIETE